MSLLVHTLLSEPSLSEPDFVEVMGPNESIDFEVGEGETEQWGFYGSPQAQFWECSLYKPESGEYVAAETGHPEGGPHFTKDGEWQLVGILDTDTPGENRMLCRGENGSGAQYALGDLDAYNAVLRQENFVIIGGNLIPFFGVLLGLAVLATTAILRLVRKRTVVNAAS